MTTVKDIFDFLNKKAPVDRKMDFDNAGILVGRPENPVRKILVSLDITGDVADEAVRIGADLIVTHHPAFFELKHIRSDVPGEKMLITLIENGISLICMHTNLDVAQGGVCDALAHRVGLTNIEWISRYGDDYGLGRFGELDREYELSEYMKIVKASLGCNGIRYVDAGRPVKRVGVCGGSGGNEIMSVIEAGCDTYITGDVKHDIFLTAKAYGINLIDAGHFPTENVIIEPLANEISGEFPDVFVSISQSAVQPELYF